MYRENYKDRGMVKWAGFYLSEHTDTLEEQSAKEKNLPQQKPQMSPEEIGQILSEAVLKNRKVAVQIEERDLEGHYKPDIIDFVKGSDELSIYIGTTKVGYDEIRHISFSKKLKWSNTKRFE